MKTASCESGTTLCLGAKTATSVAVFVSLYVKVNTMKRGGFSSVIILIIVIIILILGATFYLFEKNRSQTITLPTNSVVPIVATSSGAISISSTTENTIVIPPGSFASPDGQWVAFEKNPYGLALVENPMGTTTTIGELDIVNSSQSTVKIFTPAQLFISPTCSCSVSILGWGNGVLWLENTPNEEGPINSFLKVNTADWSVESYPSKVFDISFQDVINFDTGKFVMTDLPWGPNSEDNPEQDAATYSVSIYDIQTGTSQIIETTTAQLADPAETIFGSDLKWIDDNTLQYYNFRSGAVATTTASG
jgi:hypothetical protein